MVGHKEDKVVAEFTVNTMVGKLVAEYKVNWVDRLVAEVMVNWVDNKVDK